jgi:hypothetical protein
MTDRTDETDDLRGPSQRLVVVASLRPGSRDEAARLVANGPPYDLGEAGFERHSVFLAAETAVFLFEGPGIEGLARDLVNDPSRSAAFSAWGPLLDHAPTVAREEFYWEGATG